MNFKEILIGELIKKRVDSMAVDVSRITSFLNCSREEVEWTYRQSSIDCKVLLKWSKLLEYDFFRVYSQHLILYAPATMKPNSRAISGMPQFRKNIYTKELIDFILELINSGKKNRQEVIQDYSIPKATLYRWIAKSGKSTG